MVSGRENQSIAAAYGRCFHILITILVELFDQFDSYPFVYCYLCVRSLLIELILLNFYDKRRINDFRYHSESETEQKQKATATAAAINAEPLFSRWFNTIFVYNFIFFHRFFLSRCSFADSGFFSLSFLLLSNGKGEERRARTCIVYRRTLRFVSHKAAFSHSRIIESVFHRFAQDEGSRTRQTHFVRLKSDQKPKPSSGYDERVNPIKTAYAKVHKNKKKSV